MIDWTKPIQRRNGTKARFIAKINCDNFPYIVAITNNVGKEYVENYRESGKIKSFEVSDYDLINVQEEHEGWINISNNYNVFGIYKTKEQAQLESNSFTIAHIKITWKYGDGL